MTNTKLPVGWTKCKLEDCCHINLGQSPDSSTYNDNATGLPFFQGKADFGKLYPTVTHWCSKPKKIAEKGDVLLSVRAPVGSVNISTEQCCIGRGLAALRGYFDITPLFIFYLIQFSENELHKRETGTTFKAITGDRLKSLPINLPPLAEQKRIVAKIEELFAEVDKGIDLLKQKQAELKKYRQSVLHAAFSGKLYKTTEWETTTLGHLIEISSGYSGKQVKYKTKYPLTRIETISKEIIDFNRIGYVENIPEEKRYKLCKGDILFSNINSDFHLGKTAIFNHDKILYHGTNLLLFRPLQEKILSNYLNYNLKYLRYRGFFIKIAQHAVNQSSINQKKLSSISLNIPTRNEQTQIIKEIEQRFEQADKLEETLSNSLTLAEKLKQSILKKAFEGKLVPQDPNDEPASVLLERIKAEQANTTKKKGKKK